MSSLDLAIAERSEKVSSRQDYIRRRKSALQKDAMNYCRKPSTFARAFLLGAAVGLVYPPRRKDNVTNTRSAERRPLLPPYFSTPLQLLLFKTITGLFSRTDKSTDIEGSQIQLL